MKSLILILLTSFSLLSAKKIADNILSADSDPKKFDAILEASNTEGILNEIAIEYGLAGLKLAKKLNDQALIIEATQNLSDIYKKDFQIDKAIDLWFEIYQLGEEKNDIDLLLDSYRNIGELYLEKNDLQEAAKYFLIGIKFALDNKKFKYQTVFYFNLGEINKLIEDYDKALNYYNSALENIKNHPEEDHRLTSRIFAGKANTFIQQNKKLEAKIAIDSCLFSFNDSTTAIEKSRCLNFAGEIYSKNDKRKEALEFYLKALELSIRAMDKKNIAHIKFNIAELQTKNKNFQKAKFYAIQAFEESKKLNSPTIKNKSSELLSQIFFSLNNIDSAYYYLNLSSELSKQLFNLEKEEIVKDLLTKYRSEEIERQNKLLSDQIELEKTKNLNITLIWIFS